MVPRFSYVRAGSEEEALKHLRTPGSAVHSGGTDLLGCLRDGVFAVDKVVSLSGLDSLRGIRPLRDGSVRIGAMTSIAELAANETVRNSYPGLAQAASDVASPQLRNQGTVGGNLCQRPRCWYFRGEFRCAKKGGAMCYAVDGENRYHAILGGGPCYIVHPSDTAPMLQALGASLHLEGADGERTILLEDFFQLPADNLEAENVLGTGEIVTELLVPPPAGIRSTYRKVRERGSWDFALASVALALRFEGGRVSSARVVLGGVAPVPWRATAAEEALTGRPLTAATAAEAAEAAVQGAEPLAQNAYKVTLIRGIVEESLLTLSA